MRASFPVRLPFAPARALPAAAPTCRVLTTAVVVGVPSTKSTRTFDEMHRGTTGDRAVITYTDNQEATP